MKIMLALVALTISSFSAFADQSTAPSGRFSGAVFVRAPGSAAVCDSTGQCSDTATVPAPTPTPVPAPVPSQGSGGSAPASDCVATTWPSETIGRGKQVYFFPVFDLPAASSGATETQVTDQDGRSCGPNVHYETERDFACESGGWTKTALVAQCNE